MIPWRRSIESSIAVPNEKGLGNGFVVADSLGRFLFTGSLGRFASIDSLGRFVFTDSQGRFVSIDSLGRFVFTDSLGSSEDRNFISKKTHGCCYYAAQSDISRNPSRLSRSKTGGLGILASQFRQRTSSVLVRIHLA